MSNMQKSHQSSPAKAVIKSAKTEHKQKASLNPAQLMQAPETMRSEDVIGAQKQVGNQVVQRALDSHQHSDQAADQQGNLRKDLAQQIQQKRGSGSPLPGNIRKEVGQKMGRSFSDVRVHTDAKADQLNRSISARANATQFSSGHSLSARVVPWASTTVACLTACGRVSE